MIQAYDSRNLFLEVDLFQARQHVAFDFHSQSLMLIPPQMRLGIGCTKSLIVISEIFSRFINTLNTSNLPKAQLLTLISNLQFLNEKFFILNPNLKIPKIPERFISQLSIDLTSPNISLQPRERSLILNGLAKRRYLFERCRELGSIALEIILRHSMGHYKQQYFSDRDTFNFLLILNRIAIISPHDLQFLRTTPYQPLVGMLVEHLKDSPNILKKVMRCVPFLFPADHLPADHLITFSERHIEDFYSLVAARVQTEESDFPYHPFIKWLFQNNEHLVSTMLYYMEKYSEPQSEVEPEESTRKFALRFSKPLITPCTKLNLQLYFPSPIINLIGNYLSPTLPMLLSEAEQIQKGSFVRRNTNSLRRRRVFNLVNTLT
jgi:hypothetical protein